MPEGRAVDHDLWELLRDLPPADPIAVLRARLLSCSPARVVRLSRSVARSAQALLARCGASGSDADLLLALAVVAEGRSAYEAVMADPERLWEAEPDDLGEALTTLPTAAYEALTGLTLVWSDEHGLLDDPYLGGRDWLTFAGYGTGPKGGLPRGYVDWLRALLRAAAEDDALTAWWHSTAAEGHEGVELSIDVGRHHGATAGVVRVRRHRTWLEVEVHSRGRRGSPSALALAQDDLAAGLLGVAARQGGRDTVEAALRGIVLPAVTTLLQAAARTQAPSPAR